jgi:ligand-binding sensor domain-containing protein/signal transduction histidine kinase
VCLLLVLSSSIYAERLPIKTYTIADGLVRDSILRIVRDSHGYLWFCTGGGLSRFDGYQFTNYTTEDGLPSPAVTDLLETRRGVYWVATSNGLCRFNPTASKTDRPRAPRDPAGSSVAGRAEDKAKPKFVVYRFTETKNAHRVTSLYEDRTGTVWCGTIGGLYRLQESQGRWQAHFIDIGMPPEEEVPWSHSIMVLQEDRQGALWGGTGIGDLYRRFPDGRHERYTGPNGLPYVHISAVLQDREGRLWVGTRDKLYRLVSDPHPSRPVIADTYSTADGLASNTIYALFQSSDGKLWAGTASGISEGISPGPGGCLRFTSYTLAHGLSDASIGAFAEDRHSNLWIGTNSGGAMRIARNGFTTYDKADGLAHNDVRSVFENQKGELFVNTHEGFIHQFDGRRFTALRPKAFRKIKTTSWGTSQITFQDSTGAWWIATGEGLLRYAPTCRFEQLAQASPQAWYSSNHELAGDDVFRLLEDSRGDVWIGAFGPPRNGLMRWKHKTGTWHDHSEGDGLSLRQEDGGPTAFCEDRAGHLWVGISGHWRLAHYRQGRFTILAVEGLPGGWIRDLYVDHAGRLWVATARGLACSDNPEAEPPHFLVYTTAQGLSSSATHCLTEDAQGRLYIGTDNGLDRLDPQTGRIKHYTTADGLASNLIRTAFRDRHGALWFGTPRGLSRLIPEPDPPPLVSPVVIRGLRIRGEPYPLSDLGEESVTGLVLEAQENALQIDFAGLGFAPGETLRYQYRLEGADREWSPLSSQRTVNFASLSPGAYRFVVQAVTAGGLASSQPAHIAFTIRPPVWQQGWFLALAALLAGAVIYVLYRARVRRLVELERVRTRIATDLHDDIGASLSQIAILSEVVGQRVDRAAPEVAEPLARIASVSRELVDTMSDIVWAINPKRDRLSDLTQRMRRFASDLFTARQIAFTFQGASAEADLKLEPDLRREVFLIFKESVNNIARHSKGTEAHIRFGVEQGWLTLQVTDNGQGFEGPPRKEGQGLVSMPARARKLGGELTVRSEPGAGTCVTLTVPLSRRG